MVNNDLIFIVIYSYSNGRDMYLVKSNHNIENTGIISYKVSVHGRLIHTVKTINITDKLALILTGSEDTNINIFSLNLTDINSKFITNCLGLQLIDEFARHTGAIRQIETVKIDITDKTINIICASVGASSECFLFKIFAKYKNEEIIELEIIFLADLTVKQKDLDTRNMGVSSVILQNKHTLIVISNTLGNKEVFEFDFSSSENQIIRHSTIKVSESSFIAICNSSISYNNNILTLEGQSNGIIRIESIVEDNKNKILKQYKIHEAGINDLQTRKNNSLINIFTGGEDNSVVISQIDQDINLIILYKIGNNHSSPIKTLKLINQEYFVSGGYDQLINLTQINYSRNNNKNKNKQINICLSEINCLDIVNTENDNTKIIIAVGQGLEIHRLEI